MTEPQTSASRAKTAVLIMTVLLGTLLFATLCGCVQAKGNAGSLQGLTLLTPRVAVGIDTRTGQESENAYEFLNKVMTVESKQYSGAKSPTRNEEYIYYDKDGKELFELLDYGDGRHYRLTVGSNVTTWTFDLTEATDGGGASSSDTASANAGTENASNARK